MNKVIKRRVFVSKIQFRYKMIVNAGFGNLERMSIITQSTIKKKKKQNFCEFAVTSYATVTAYYLILSMVGGEFWNNIYAKQIKHMNPR